LNAYKAGGTEKREVCSDLLDRIQGSSMRSVIVSPDYENLLIIHTARRLYKRRGLQAEENQDMSRRFAVRGLQNAVADSTRRSTASVSLCAHFVEMVNEIPKLLVGLTYSSGGSRILTRVARYRYP
jgi:hypothetical protein